MTTLGMCLKHVKGCENKQTQKETMIRFSTLWNYMNSTSKDTYKLFFDNIHSTSCSHQAKNSMIFWLRTRKIWQFTFRVVQILLGNWLSCFWHAIKQLNLFWWAIKNSQNSYMLTYRTRFHWKETHLLLKLTLPFLKNTSFTVCPQKDNGIQSSQMQTNMAIICYYPTTWVMLRHLIVKQVLRNCSVFPERTTYSNLKCN